MNDGDPLRTRYLRRFKLGILLLVLLAIPAIVHSHAAIDSLFNRPADWIPDSLPEKATFNDFTDHFSVSDLIMVAWDGSTLDSDSLDRATEMLRPLCESDFQSETDAETIAQYESWYGRKLKEIRRECGTPTPLRWVRSGTETLERLTSVPASLGRASAVRRLQGTLIGEDGEKTCLLVSFGEAAVLNRRTLLPAIRYLIGREMDLEPHEIAVVGNQFDGATVDAESVRTIRTFSPPSAIIAAILCLICLRSIPMTAVIVAVAVIGEGLVLAAVYYTGTDMNAVLIVLPPLVFVLTVSAGIHLSNYYLDAAHDFPELSRAQAAQRAMRAGVVPCSLATGTTVIGLGSLMLVRLVPVKVFGGVASFGVIITLLLLFMVMPGAMVLTRPRRRAENEDELRGGIRGFARTWMRRRLARPWPLIIGFLVVASVLSVGLTRLESTVNVPRMFLPESDIRQQYAWFEKHIGPTVTGELLLSFPEITEDDDPLERLSLVAKAHRAVLDLDVVGGALSAMTFVPSLSRQKRLAATAQRSVVRKLIRDPESSLGRLGFIAHDPDREIWRISIRMPQHDRADFGDDIAAIENAVRACLIDNSIPVDVSLTGSVVIVQKSQEILLRDLYRSFVTAFGIIAIVMIVMLRSVVGGLLAMAPNLFPTVTLFGLMGLMRIPLDIGSVMSASVALGIAVDDTVHLLSRYGSRRARGLGQIRAAFGALAQCGWAMFQTTLVCGVALMAYWFSDFVPTSRFSLFMFGLLSSALLGVVFLLPTLMASPMGKWLARTIGANPNATVFADVPENDSPVDLRRLPTRFGKTRLPDSSESGQPIRQESVTDEDHASNRDT